MKRLFSVLLLASVLFFMAAPAVFAADAAAPAAAPTATAAHTNKMHYYALAVLGAEVGIGLAALGTGAGQGSAVNGACQGIARNPGVMGKIMTTMIIGLAMIESLAIYALVIIFLVFFANPFKI